MEQNKTTPSRLLAILAGILLFFPLSDSCADDSTIAIGGLFGLTGDSSQFGRGELDGATLAIEEWNARGGINGRQIILESEDTGTTQTKALLGFEKLTDRSGHKFLIGPTWLDTFQGTLLAAERKHVLLLTPSAEGRAFSHTNPKDPWGLTCFYSSETEVSALLTALRDEGVKSIIGTYTQEPFFQLMKRMVEEQAPKLGITILGSYDYDMGFSDFRSAMTKYAAKKPDVLLNFQTAESSIVNFLRSQKQVFPSAKVAGIHDIKGYIQSPEFRVLAQGMYFSDFELVDTTFADSFKKRFGYEAILTYSNAYDATNILLKGMAAGIHDGKTMQQFILNGKFKTATFGDTSFLSDGRIKGTKIVVNRVEGENIRTIPP